VHTRAGVPSERRQFRILYRDFLSRLVDLEAFSSRGEIQKLLVQFVSMMPRSVSSSRWKQSRSTWHRRCPGRR